VLGVGAQKAGTTWLHDYLHSRSDVDMGFAKEYHIFNALFVPQSISYFNDRISEGLGYLNGAPSNFFGHSNVFKLLDFLHDLDHYFDYFHQLIRGDSHLTLTGDITPAYAGLPAPAFQMIREKLIQRGFRPKVVFLMRDPVERCISAIRMFMKKDRIPSSPELEERYLLIHYATPSFEMRTRYDKTIQVLESVFPPDEIFYGFYETLFTETTIRSLCDFLELPYEDANFGRIINASNTGHQLGHDVKKIVRDHYEDVYRFISQRFPLIDVRSFWKQP
jgi:hypothetical protein